MTHAADLFSATVANPLGDGELPRRDDRPSSFAPRPYQVEARAAVRAMWSEHGPGGVQPLLVKFTGTGKTLTALHIAQDLLAEGHRVVWLADRQELLSQPLADLGRNWPRIRGGIVQAAKDVVDAQVTFLSVDTARVPGRTERILEHGYPALIVVDEAHGSLAPKFRKAIEKLRGPDTVLLGLTATPDRSDGGDLSELWEIAFTYGPTEAINGGWVVPPFAAVDKLDHIDEVVAEVPVNADGEYDDEELGRVLLLNGIVDWTVAAMGRRHTAKRLPFRDQEVTASAKGRTTLVFCASIEQAEKTCEALRVAGWEARFITGTTPSKDRARLLDQFRKGRVEVLVNVGTLTTGTDVPRASCVVLARPLGSWVLFCQILGRGMRIFCPDWNPAWGFCNALDPRYAEHGGKADCFVLDLAGASDRHSIVSAPVLIGGSRCRKAPDGRHDYQPLRENTSRGRCSHCSRTIPCLPALHDPNTKQTGRHVWVDFDPPRDGIERGCRCCGGAQCSKAPNGRHVWAPLEVERITVCVECDAEVPFGEIGESGTLDGLVGERDKVRVYDAKWLRVSRPAERPGQTVDLVPETWAADIGGQGLVIVVGDRSDGMWWPFWVRKGAHRARPLASGPIRKEDVRLRCSDLLRRVQRSPSSSTPSFGGKVTPAQLEYGERLGRDLRGMTGAQASTEITRAIAWERATTLGLAKTA